MTADVVAGSLLDGSSAETSVGLGNGVVNVGGILHLLRDCSVEP